MHASLLLLLATPALASLFSRRMATKGSDFICGPAVALPTLCDTLSAAVNTDPTKCKCELTATNQCGMDGTYSCDANTGTLDGSVKLSSDFDAGTMTIASTVLVTVSSQDVNITATVTLPLTIPLPSMDDVTTYKVGSCAATAEAVNPSEDAKKVLGNNLDTCTCKATGDLPLPAIEVTCKAVQFDVTP